MWSEDRAGHVKRSRRRIAVLLAVAALVLTACREAPPEEHVIDEPVTVEHAEGTDIARLTLTAKAAERLGIQTARVEKEGQQAVISSAAVLVDPDGDFWVYTNPEPLVFVRHAIRIDYEEGGQAYVSTGPRPGTKVVTVGVAELYGAEFGIGH
jgi:hypothetical protein